MHVLWQNGWSYDHAFSLKSIQCLFLCLVSLAWWRRENHLCRVAGNTQDPIRHAISGSGDVNLTLSVPNLSICIFVQVCEFNFFLSNTLLDVMIWSCDILTSKLITCFRRCKNVFYVFLNLCHVFTFFNVFYFNNVRWSYFYILHIFFHLISWIFI